MLDKKLYKSPFSKEANILHKKFKKQKDSVLLILYNAVFKLYLLHYNLPDFIFSSKDKKTSMFHIQFNNHMDSSYFIMAYLFHLYEFKNAVIDNVFLDPSQKLIHIIIAYSDSDLNEYKFESVNLNFDMVHKIYLVISKSNSFDLGNIPISFSVSIFEKDILESEALFISRQLCLEGLSDIQQY
jgi:hypothetical protein